MSAPESAGEATALDDLIARLEAATGPDPRLDAEIEAHIRGGVPAYRCHDSTRTSYGPSAVFERDDGSNILSGDWWSAPSLTGSLDAAAAIVPEGTWYFFGAGKTRPDEPLFGAMILPANGDPDTAPELGKGEHFTSLPIAICIAALRARAQESGHE